MALKSYTSYQQQLQILEKHGCVIGNKADCIKRLAEIGYYRLSAYFAPFRNPDKSFKAGTSFEAILRVYEFDKKLRLILFSAIEDIEIFLRSSLSQMHADRHGALGYIDTHNFSNAHDHARFMGHVNAAISNNCHVTFVKHHLTKYNGQFPIWVVIHLFTFGMLSYFYSDLPTQEQKYIASNCFKLNYKDLRSWLRCCTDLRNICAHYDRLYYRIFTTIPAGFNNLPLNVRTRLWGTMLVLRELYPDADKWNMETVPELKRLFKKYKQNVNLYHLAFPKDWAKLIRK